MLEPYAYKSAFPVRWLIQDQINCDLRLANWASPCTLMRRTRRQTIEHHQDALHWAADQSLLPGSTRPTTPTQSRSFSLSPPKCVLGGLAAIPAAFLVAERGQCRPLFRPAEAARRRLPVRMRIATGGRSRRRGSETRPKVRYRGRPRLHHGSWFLAKGCGETQSWAGRLRLISHRISQTPPTLGNEVSGRPQS